MGADNSKPDPKQSKTDLTAEQVERALAQQRRMYEQKCEELRQAQRQTDEKLQQVQQNINLQQTSSHVFQPTGILAHAPLYPNLQNVANNNFEATAVYANSSASYFQSPSSAGLSPSLAPHPTIQPRPTAPPEPEAEAIFGYAGESINKPNPPVLGHAAQHINKPCPPLQAQTVTQPRRPATPSFQPIPSTSSSTAQLVKKAPPHTKQQTRKTAQNDASDSIAKCVTCSNELGIQIYQCTNGHSSCKPCRQRNTSCGTCRNPITDMRNIMLETHIADIKLKELDKGERMKCPNSYEGCRLSFKRNEIEEHKQECPYRLMPCPLAAIFGICTWKGRINELVTHFKEEHQEHMAADVDKEMYLLNINVNHRVVYFVNLGAFNFLVHIQVDANTKTICMVAQSMSTKFSASKWSYELHVYNKSQPRRKYRFVDTCISNTDSVQENFTQKKCAVLNSDYAKTFLDNNRLAYKFYIKKESRD